MKNLGIMGLETWRIANDQANARLSTVINEFMLTLPHGRPVSSSVQKLIKMYQHIQEERRLLNMLDRRFHDGEDEQILLQELYELLERKMVEWDQLQRD